MDGEADALALDDARIEDSVTCEGCGASVYCSEHVLSPYEADDGGAYCIDCAQREWARAVEEAVRLRKAAQRALSFLAVCDGAYPTTAQQALRAALAPAAGEGASE